LPKRRSRRRLRKAVAASGKSADNGLPHFKENCMNQPAKTAVAMAALLLACTSVLAQAVTDSEQRREQKRADLSGAPGMEVISSIAEYKPGEAVMRHQHHGVETGYVIQGATIQPASGAPMVLATGSTLLNLRGVMHGGFKVVGDTSLKLFTVHIVDKGKPLYDPTAAP
jgi:quercetin dioxygenase-like cupin family protein